MTDDNDHCLKFIKVSNIPRRYTERYKQTRKLKDFRTSDQGSKYQGSNPDINSGELISNEHDILKTWKE